jgi:hypothetical protein
MTYSRHVLSYITVFALRHVDNPSNVTWLHSSVWVQVWRLNQKPA